MDFREVISVSEQPTYEKIGLSSNIDCLLDQGFESRWMSVELLCYVTTIIAFYKSFTTSFVGGIF